MIRYYCTLFDKNFLAKGLALYASLLEHSEVNWKIYILCLDKESYDILQKLNLSRATLISLSEIEDNDLLKAKSNRNYTEYCWTLTPSLPLYLLNNKPEIDLITYLDADLFFYSSPEQIFKEFGNSSILLIPHNLPPEKRDKEKVVGKYNVGMMIFRRDKSGIDCLNWWRTQCNDWCYEVPVDGKLGDQKYLDYFEEKFTGIHVSRHPGVNLAGWNLKNFRGKIVKKNTQVFINDYPLIFFHFSSYKLYYPQNNLLPNGPTGAHKYFFPSIEKKLIYKKYTETVIIAYKQIRRLFPEFRAGLIDRPNIIKQINETVLPLVREFLAKKFNTFIRKMAPYKLQKNLIILEHNNGRLANQLWNFISIYAYALEKNFSINNYCFNIYAEYFNIPLNNYFIKLLFYNRFNKGLHTYRRLNFYNIYLTFIRLFFSKRIVRSGEDVPFYLSPSINLNSESTDRINKLESSPGKNIYFSGWLFRNTEGIKKYREKIVKYFQPKQEILDYVDNLIDPLKKTYRLLVGVHIRQTDFKTFVNGKYYFSPKEVAVILNDFIKCNNLNKDEIVFIVCSDEIININDFSGLNIVTPKGNAVEDLFTLSKTNIIIGTDSTYGAWAAYYGNIPIVFFNRDKMHWPSLNQSGFNFPEGHYRK